MARNESLPLSRQLSIAVAAVAVLVCFLLLLRGPLMADPQANFFFKAQQLQAQGLTDLALKHYRLISQYHPESAYAPASLKAQADILTGLARKSEDRAQFREAIRLYRQLADTYSSDRDSGDALLAAAGIAKDDLGDASQARTILKQVLERFPNNAGYAAKATVQLGRLALEAGQKDEAKTLLQSVLQKFPRVDVACAEAQYHLGVLYETLFNKKDAAQRAYEATFEHYPRTIWAANAKERLGMLIFQASDKHPERLVMVELQPVPDDGGGDGDDSLLEALRPLLAARGLSSDASTLRGWSLKPFWGAFDPNQPGRVVEAPFNDFINVTSSANLFFNRYQDANEVEALGHLQRELDAARPLVIYNGAWRLVVGYDSEHEEIFVQSRGARVQSMAVKEFLAAWKRKAPDGGAFTSMIFYAPGEKARISRVTGDKAKAATGAITKVSIKATPTMPTINPAVPEPTPTPVPTPVSLGLTPTFVFQLKPLSAPDAHRRALRSAVKWMRRSRVADKDTALLNLDALDAMATALERVAKAPATAVGEESPVPLPEADPTLEKPIATPLSMPLAVPLATPLASPTVAPTATVSPVLSAAQKLERARQLAQWFRAPLQSWVRARRDAASYLQGAAGPLRRAQLKQAAENLRLSVNELSSAAAAMPAPETLEENGALTDSARRALLDAARHVRAARTAEAKATDQMDF